MSEGSSSDEIQEDESQSPINVADDSINYPFLDDVADLIAIRRPYFACPPDGTIVFINIQGAVSYVFSTIMPDKEQEKIPLSKIYEAMIGMWILDYSGFYYQINKYNISSIVHLESLSNLDIFNQEAKIIPNERSIRTYFQFNFKENVSFPALILNIINNEFEKGGPLTISDVCKIAEGKNYISSFLTQYTIDSSDYNRISTFINHCPLIEVELENIVSIKKNFDSTNNSVLTNTNDNDSNRFKNVNSNQNLDDPEKNPEILFNTLLENDPFSKGLTLEEIKFLVKGLFKKKEINNILSNDRRVFKYFDLYGFKPTTHFVKQVQTKYSQEQGELSLELVLLNQLSCIKEPIAYNNLFEKLLGLEYQKNNKKITISSEHYKTIKKFIFNYPAMIFTSDDTVYLTPFESEVDLLGGLYINAFDNYKGKKSLLRVQTHANHAEFLYLINYNERPYYINSHIINKNHNIMQKEHTSYCDRKCDSNGTSNKSIFRKKHGQSFYIYLSDPNSRQHFKKRKEYFSNIKNNKSKWPQIEKPNDMSDDEYLITIAIARQCGFHGGYLKDRFFYCDCIAQYLTGETLNGVEMSDQYIASKTIFFIMAKSKYFVSIDSRFSTVLWNNDPLLRKMHYNDWTEFIAMYSGIIHVTNDIHSPTIDIFDVIKSITGNTRMKNSKEKISKYKQSIEYTIRNRREFIFNEEAKTFGLARYCDPNLIYAIGYTQHIEYFDNRIFFKQQLQEKSKVQLILSEVNFPKKDPFGNLIQKKTKSSLPMDNTDNDISENNNSDTLTSISDYFSKGSSTKEKTYQKSTKEKQKQKSQKSNSKSKEDKTKLDITSQNISLNFGNHFDSFFVDSFENGDADLSSWETHFILNSDNEEDENDDCSPWNPPALRKSKLQFSPVGSKTPTQQFGLKDEGTDFIVPSVGLKNNHEESLKKRLDATIKAYTNACHEFSIDEQFSELKEKFGKGMSNDDFINRMFFNLGEITGNTNSIIQDQ